MPSQSSGTAARQSQGSEDERQSTVSPFSTAKRRRKRQANIAMRARQLSPQLVDAEPRQAGPRPGTGPAAAVAAALCEAVGRATAKELPHAYSLSRASAQQLPQANSTGKRSARKRPAHALSEASPSLASPHRRSPARPTSAESRAGQSQVAEPARSIQLQDYEADKCQPNSPIPVAADNAAEDKSSAARQQIQAQTSSNEEQLEGEEAEDAPPLNPLETLAEAVLSQPVAFRNYKGQSRQMITMTFLEEGGFFDMPIQNASVQLGLGVTTLKRVCRENGVKRWPYRKRNSLGRLIDRTKQVLDDGTGQNNLHRLAALQVLEQQRQSIKSSQAADLDDQTKAFRQAIYKYDHVQRRDSGETE